MHQHASLTALRFASFITQLLTVILACDAIEKTHVGNIPTFPSLQKEKYLCISAYGSRVQQIGCGGVQLGRVGSVEGCRGQLNTPTPALPSFFPV